MDLVISILALAVLVLFLLGVFYSPYLWQEPPTAAERERDRALRQAKRARRARDEAGTG